MATINSVGNGLTGSTGTGNFVGSNTPTLVTPVLGAATATSINFGGSSLANYVTGGTFTPFITFVTAGNLSVSYATQTGFYSRIGNIVTVIIALTFTPTFTTASGSFIITGLPLTINASMNPVGPINITAVTVPPGTTNNVLSGVPGGTNCTVVAVGPAAESAWSTTQFTSGTQAVLNASLTYLI